VAPLVGVDGLGAFFFPERGVLLVRPYAAVVALALAAGTLLGVTAPGQRVEWNLYDLYAKRAARNAEPAPGIVIVAIDEPSFAEVGLPWPWPRALHATLIDRLAEGGAKTIAVDLLFDVPSKSAEDDAALAESIRRAGSVILAADQAVTEDRGYTITQWSDPIPALADVAAGLGVIRIPYDADGVLRRATLQTDGRPSLALATALRESAFAPPPDSDRPRLFRYNGEPRHGVLTVSYYQALDPEHSLPRGLFAGKHVFVGRALQTTTIDEQSDHFTTPVSVRMPGVEIHANILDALLRKRFIADPFAPWGWLVALCVLAGALSGAALFRLGPTAAPLAAAAIVAVLLGIGFVALSFDIRVPAVAPALTVTGVYALTAAYKFGLTTRERRLIKRAFQHYVAPAIVEQMLDDPSRLKLGGEEYEVTVLFSDLEGFTTLSEHLTPAQLSAHLGRYFKEMLDVLLPQHGTLDKLIGDAIMMYFGCPIVDARHAAQACRGALAMQQRMVSLNSRWAAEGLPQLRTRIGINTGRAVAGNMGTDTIFNYTILGDCVNLASRLEGTNKVYGSVITLGEDTWARVHGEFETRELDWLRVKGKMKPVAIYELVAEAGALDERRKETFRWYAQGLALYREARWRDAARAFEAALQVEPLDGPSRALLARCASYQRQEPERWDGVHVMESK
jgi:adenylate cyclase